MLKRTWSQSVKHADQLTHKQALIAVLGRLRAFHIARKPA
ncbi:hypothetical protein XBP1_1080016 [Xenorhabdus bovienii str. puntauvense]|uniref:Uncharacterized protein n=1 Tax=Xenorhabdus bovienii str. puntauvense TaxID=1398201 RepID=A0A077NA71_XENBV|nr:hypothetical protein XBP1_1080016 [Xenorhabdus bovienii str. puntauvense]